MRERVIHLGYSLSSDQVYASRTYVAILIENNASRYLFLQAQSHAYRRARSVTKSRRTCGRALYLYGFLERPTQLHSESG
jgi:hypothetical protein